MSRTPERSPRIKTTVVGSYPVPDWLVAPPSQQALIDATRVVFKTQEMAGIDVVADGELYRFDVNHPDTNGMIEYFIRPMSGIRSAITLDEVMAYRAMPGMRFRTEPAGVVEGPVDEGTLNLPRDYQRASALATQTLKFTLTGPHMLSKTLMDHHYARPRRARARDRRRLAKQVRHLDPRSSRSTRPTSPATPTKATGPRRDQPHPRRRARRRRRSTSASATTAANHPERHLGS